MLSKQIKCDEKSAKLYSEFLMLNKNHEFFKICVTSGEI